jgi:peptidoglycan/LPS O-acetylase OafA/YrhL
LAVREHLASGREAAAGAGRDMPEKTKEMPAHRIPGLDGLRAASIAFVLVGHLDGTRNFELPSVLESFIESVPLASIGVRMFFVISGFLITCLLIDEERRTGGVSLKHFYFRRTLRIFPPFYAFIGAVMLLEATKRISLSPGDLLHAATYTMNYHRDRAWYLGHTWSLAVEEQFYLLWPFIYTAVRRHRIELLAGYVLLAPVWRLFVSYFLPGERIGIGETFFTTADSIAVGCLLALLRPALLDCIVYRRIVDTPVYLLILPALFALGALERFAKLDFAVCMSAQNVLLAIFVERITRTSGGGVAAVLNARPVVAIGVWSYSLYLWQQLFINHRAHHSLLTAFPYNLIFAVALAVLSYYAVERPSLRLRQRLEGILFPSRLPGRAAGVETGRASAASG